MSLKRFIETEAALSSTCSLMVGEVIKREKLVQLLDFICIQCLLITFTLILKLMSQEQLLGAHGAESDLVVILIPVLPQAVEAIFLMSGLDCTHAPDDASGYHQSSHGGRCQKDREVMKNNKPLIPTGIHHNRQ